MTETLELRVEPEFGRRIFDACELLDIGSSNVAKVSIRTDDPRMVQIGVLSRELKSKDNSLFYGWDLSRRYSASELKAANLFQLLITKRFEPTGEECGTIYDEKSACPICGAGRRQVSDLILDLRKLPKNKDIAATIAGEVIVSQRLARLLLDSKANGFRLQPVLHKAKYDEEPVKFERYVAGRRLLELAKASGFEPYSWEFDVWANKPEHDSLWEQLNAERVAAAEAKEIQRPPRPAEKWYQLCVTSTVDIVAPTKAGINPFDDDPASTTRCPLGHLIGLNLLSELWISKDSWDKSDIARTRQMVGVRRGLLNPESLLVISPRLQQTLNDCGIKGWKIEVAHLS